MNRFAYYMSGYAFKAFSGFSKTRVTLHGEENIPRGSIIYTANHFTRIETVFLPYHIHGITKKPVWSLAAAELFQGALKGTLEAMGAVSTKDPRRDFLIVKGLLSGRAECIIFPEGLMVKNKKILVDEGFRIYQDGEFQRPHTGAATIALRTEFYRERLRRAREKNLDEFNRLVEIYEIDSPDTVLDNETFIMPVNITYYPVRAKENMLSRIAQNMIDNPSRRMMDELMTEGTMVFSGVDVDIRFGRAISVRDIFSNGFVESDVTSRRRVEFSPRLSSNHVMRSGALDLMNQYMSQVYGMTTLNYDHIFASILKYLPDDGKIIDGYEFRCRAFLATQACNMSLHCHFHKSLYDNQVHILIDDRFSRYEDFMRVAYETGVVSIQGDQFNKNQAKFTTHSEFHTARVENPVSVIANEVEPLVSLQAYFKELAVKSGHEILELIREQLLAKHQSEFEADFMKSESDEIIRDKRCGAPLLLRGNKDTPAVLLLHDYLSSPGEMKPLATHLNDKGFTVYVPRLKGHGTSVEDLAGVSFEQWLESAEEALVVVRHLRSRFAVGGVGMGGSMAIYLQARSLDPFAFFAVSPPFSIKDFSTSFTASSGVWWQQMMKKAGTPSEKKVEDGNGSVNSPGGYDKNPVAGMKQVEKFLDQTEPFVKKIKAPGLIIQCRNNPVVDVQGSEKIFKRLGSDIKEFYLFDIKQHGLPPLGSQGSARMFGAICQFLMGVLSLSHKKNHDGREY
ncbi:Esterase/lipase [Desulfocicer vacuolatum DSM 3385]|uniref:Esterase/lipase n=1 Tax=Desulfocicer vacuolatum DSM 3385 TaxID=1121400 RepID=A0A1W2E3U3_9BACT|nr:alpha/beta hydrolase [Desulfocicer vacuolatum]SMD03936.1 Esterase/lipase [Desulfocicer vacuolatum DSM 3385]